MARALTAVVVLVLALVLAGVLPAAAREGLPPDAEGAAAALESSPRHGEWVDVSYAGGPPIRTFVVYPQRSDSAPVVIVIHEIYGLTDWLRSVADQLAADGFIAVAPDLLSGLGPGGEGTESAGSRDEVVNLIRGLSPDEANRRLNVVRAFALQIPSANGRTGTVGFGWGGSRSFAYAAAQPALDAAVVYHGSSPDEEKLAFIEAPVLGLYGGDDARVNATVGPAAKKMKSLKRTYEREIYDGAGHGFLRQQTGRDGANRRASEKAWPRTVKFLRKRLVDEAF
jgi:carboxymethylenebutenolidase